MLRSEYTPLNQNPPPPYSGSTRPSPSVNRASSRTWASESKHDDARRTLIIVAVSGWVIAVLSIIASTFMTLNVQAREDGLAQREHDFYAGRDKIRQDDEDRERAQLQWFDLFEVEECLAYGTKRFTARLAHVPSHAPGLEWCKKSPIEIYGVEYPMPETCEKVGDEYVGRWTVHKGVSSCHTWFDLTEIGHANICVPGRHNVRRIVGKLSNFHPIDWADRWRALCETTPFPYRETTYASPHRCEHWGGHTGVVGVVEVFDTSCSSSLQVEASSLDTGAQATDGYTHDAQKVVESS